PFTRKIYASIHSTASQVTGNSLVALDPATGSVSTPVNIGSEPTLLAESDDGKYLYIGHKGSLSVTTYDLIAGSVGADYPLNPPPQGFGPSTPRGLAVLPGNHDVLGVDMGSGMGTGIFDISGNIGTFRSKFTGIYTGSSIAFANA